MKTLLEKIRQGAFSLKNKDTRFLILTYAKDAVAVDAENVAAWTNEQRPCFNDLAPICPQRLPFKSMWLEWLIDIDHIDRHDGEVKDKTPGKAGVLLVDEEEDDGRKIGVFGFCFVQDLGCQTEFVASFELESNDGGKSVSNMNFRKVEPTWQDDKRIPGDEGEAINMIFTICCMASLVFFSCKNTKLVPRKMNQKSKKKIFRDTGVQIQDFHVIEIHKFMTKTESQQSKGGPSFASAHLVRGHFKRFGPDNKLLGKFEGTYFWHPHVRGIGPIRVSDYRVWPPHPDHEKDCEVNK